MISCRERLRVRFFCVMYKSCGSLRNLRQLVRIRAAGCSTRRVDSLPALVGLPVPASVAGESGRRSQRPVAPEKLPVVVGALRGVRQGGVRGVDLHELVGRRRVLPVETRNVRVADPGQPPVRRLDLLAGGAGGDPEDRVEGRARRHSAMAQIRRRR